MKKMLTKTIGAVLGIYVSGAVYMKGYEWNRGLIDYITENRGNVFGPDTAGNELEKVGLIAVAGVVFPLFYTASSVIGGLATMGAFNRLAEEQLGKGEKEVGGLEGK